MISCLLIMFLLGLLLHYRMAVANLVKFLRLEISLIVSYLDS